jgi:ABC-type histidine transport system ATPase subunit
MMFQNYAQFPHLTCLDNVTFGPKMRGVRKAERHHRGRKFLDLVQMGDDAERLPGQLSVGSSSASRWRAPSSCARACCCSASLCQRSILFCVFRAEAPAARAQDHIRSRDTRAGRGHGTGS